jgi:hypothetical protein
VKFEILSGEISGHTEDCEQIDEPAVRPPVIIYQTWRWTVK